MASLQEIRQKLQEQQNRQQNNNKGSGDNQMYRFWDMKTGETAVIRFLPDGNDNNTFFWRERLMIKMPFSGIKGGDEKKGVIVNVPCVEMYGTGKTCPVLAELRNGWFDDPELKGLASTYWKKYSYIYQGFVVNDPIGEENPPENPIRRFVLNKNIHNKIKESILDPEMETIPTDYTEGRDFKINKTSNGQYASYDSSGWSMKVRSLSQQEQDAISNYGLYDLGDFLPKEPSADALDVIKEMFEASVNGELYDTERWGDYYRPYGVQAPNNTKKTETKSESKPKIQTKKPEPKQEESEPEQETPEPESKDDDSGGKKDVNAVLDTIRKRRGAQ